MRAERTQYAVRGWGEGELWLRGDVVVAHEFDFGPVSDTGVPSTRDASGRDEGRSGAAALDRAPSCGEIVTLSAHGGLDADSCLTPDALAARFAAFLAGEDVRFDDVPLDLDGSTPFQHALAAAVRAVPRGEVVSYGELAALAGYPGAARAVGTFCARNRFMFLLPCHRVVGASGIGGYGSAGVEVKRRLLALEGVAL